MIHLSLRLSAVCRTRASYLLLSAALCGSVVAPAQDKPSSTLAVDALVLKNGDTLHGKFVTEVAGKVTFHTDGLGDVILTWDKIKELHTEARFAVLDKNVEVKGRKNQGQVPVGRFDVAGDAVTVHNQGETVLPPIPVKNAQFIVDEPTLNKQMQHEPGFFSAWNGAATAGATLVTATQNQYTVSGALSLVRVVPPVSWISPRNRTSADFLGSYGKITQPAYTDATGTFVPATVTKSSIYHVDAERDQYLSTRFFALVQTAFDHNFAQDLQLQQIYGAGLGWTALKTPKQEVDLKATLQYEKQAFISGSGSTDQNLIGSTIAANYILHTKMVTYTQGVSFIPAFNTPHDYSANETDTFAFPAYKNLSFSLGTIDTYLNDSPSTFPPTKHNSFQFTMGLTYALKSKY